MVRLIPLLLLLLSNFVQAQEVTLSVDRTELARGETLTLTIRVFDQRQGMQLDLTPLTENFDVLGTRTSSQIRSINGVTESWTDYVVTLFPEEEGELEIPPLTVLRQQTAAIPISVVNAGPRSNQANDELYLEIEVNKDSVYVQEQLLFTVRLFYTINGIRNPVFTELDMPNTVTQLIGSPNQYERLIDGERYGVYEKRYVIFPQRSGPLEIPDILFRGEVTDGSSNFVFRNMNTRRVTAFIEGITIDIKERPAAAPGGEDWLPVTGLSLEESWSGNIEELQVGDSVVRTLTLQAQGLDGALLPPFSPETVDGFNLYDDPADISRTFVDGSIVGTRIEQATYVALEAGRLEIPALDIPWWDVNSDKPQSASLPAMTLEIATVDGVVPSEQVVASTENIQELLAAEPVVDQSMIEEQADADLIEVDTGLSQRSVLVIALGVLILILTGAYRQCRRAVQERFSAWRESQTPRYSEKAAFAALRRACGGNHLRVVRDSLIAWAAHYLGDSVHSTESIIQHSQEAELVEATKHLQAALFDPRTSDDYDSKRLLALVSELRKKARAKARQAERTAAFELPPLYRS